jgi:hypothetical protein
MGNTLHEVVETKTEEDSMKMMMKSCVLFLMFVAGTACFAQTTVYASPEDVQRNGLKLFNDMTNDLQMVMNSYLSMVQGGYAAEQKRFEDDELRIKALEQAQVMFADGFPCAILGLKVVKTDAGRFVQFTTPSDTCTGWAAYSGQIGLATSQARTQFSGTSLGTYDPTQKKVFSFALPDSAPAHGTFQVWTYDAGVKQNPRQVEY